MKIRISESDFYPCLNMIDSAWVISGDYPIIGKETTLDDLVKYYIIENYEGTEVYVLAEFCTVVLDEPDKDIDLTVEVRESSLYRQTEMFAEDVYLKKGNTFDVLHVLRDPDYTQYTVQTSTGVKIHLYGDEVIVRPKKKAQPVEGTENRRYMYVLVRTDMELPNIIVQSAHAAYESGLAYKNHADRTSIIILQVNDELRLREAYNELQSDGVQCTIYKENTLGLGYTAIGTEALTADQRKLLKKYKLLKIQ